MQNKIIFIFTIIFGLCVFIGLYNLLDESSIKYEGLENQQTNDLQKTLQELEGLVIQFLRKIEPIVANQLPQIGSNIEQMLQMMLQQIHEIQKKPIGEQQTMLHTFEQQIERQIPLFEKEMENQIKLLTPEQQKITIDELNKVKDKLKLLLTSPASTIASTITSTIASTNRPANTSQNTKIAIVYENY
jgi:hypothetical protein